MILAKDVLKCLGSVAMASLLYLVGLLRRLSLSLPPSLSLCVLTQERWDQDYAAAKSNALLCVLLGPVAVIETFIELRGCGVHWGTCNRTYILDLVHLS